MGARFDIVISSTVILCHDDAHLCCSYFSNRCDVDCTTVLCILADITVTIHVTGMGNLANIQLDWHQQRPNLENIPF
jgi:hypothetical protein